MDRDEIDGFGAWYAEKQGDDGDLWHRTLIDPGLLHLLGPLAPGTRVLDVGCGNGYLARRFARAGARVVGVDRSEELIRAARVSEAERPLGVQYHLADAAGPLPVDAGSFDVAVANMSLMDIENAGGAIGEVARLLRPGGRFVFSISHPCFDIDTRSAWEVTVGMRATTVFRKVAGYQMAHADRYRWPLPDGRTAETTGYHRPLAWYARTLRAAGFVILELFEPKPTDGFASRRQEPEWVAEIPLHLIVEARRDPTPGPAPA